MKKILGIITAIVIIGGIYTWYSNSPEPRIAGGDLPDYCDLFGQVGSRAIKDVARNKPSRILWFAVSSTATKVKFFQLHDQARTPKSFDTPEYSFALGGTTSSDSPNLLLIQPPVPIIMASGTSFSISNAFATFSSASTFNDRYFVTICYKDR